VSLLPSHWYYNTETGQLTQGNNLENLGNNLVGGLGWHELNIPGNASESQASAEARREFPKGKTPTNAGITPARIVSTAASQAGASVPGLGSFIGFVSTRSSWIRIAEVIIGLGLVIVAVDELAKGTPAANAAHTVAKAVLLK
jgi:hypothetical protein